MLKSIKYTITFLLTFTTILSFYSRSATAYNITLTDGSNTATYDDDFNTTGNIGFNSWQVDSQNLLTKTGWYYRLNNSGTAQPLDNLTETTATANGNSATLPYTAAGFSLNLNLSLDNSGSTINQAVTVTNNSGSNLVFDLYFYGDLATSEGNTGDTIAINFSDYTTIQSGTNKTITTTVSESNTSYIERRAEVDAIDFNEDTLLQKLQILSDSNLELDNDLGSITDTNNPVTFAYGWNYNLENNQSFIIALNSDSSSAAVPLEFSPSLGLLLSGVFAVDRYLKRKKLN